MKKKKTILIVVSIIIILCILGGGFAVFWFRFDGAKNWKIGRENNPENVQIKKENLIDDWSYNAPEYAYEDYSMVTSSETAVSVSAKSINSSFSTSDSNLGFSVGGAKNIDNFRENIKNGYLPISTDITYNGLFYDYYFDTGRSKENENSTEMFYPTYSKAISKDPISGYSEYYMTVGLNSNIKESDFQRKKLNTVIVMDISGSMSSGFNDYYYGGQTAFLKDVIGDNKSKMQIANESLNGLIDELKPEDRLGIVLFDNTSYLAKPVSLVGETDIDKLKGHILEINPRGGTNFEAGYTKGTELFTSEMLNNEEYDNRIIVITDAMPNLGNSSKEGLTKYVKENADIGIYTTFVGVGVDFNTEVIECLSDVKGANYYSVHNSEELKKTLKDEFDYMVTPLVFDLELKLDSNEFSIANVYGSDTKDNSSNTIMKVNTLFPSSSNAEGEVKGGVILLKLSPLMYTTEYTGPRDLETNIVVSYKDKDGKVHQNKQKVSFDNRIEENYDNTGIRKAIVLSRYANLMKDWILYERMNQTEKNLDVIYNENKNKLLVTSETGVIDCPYIDVEDVRGLLNQNERQSQALNVSKEYVYTLLKFKNYMKSEIKELGDNEMNQEIEILDLLVKE